MRTYTSTPAITRVLAKVVRDEITFCWTYTGATSSRGYGVTWGEGRTLSAHRVSYEHHIGPIPSGMHLDHLCRNRACVNPEHLEPVTPRENLMRSPLAPAAQNVAKTHCPRNHPYDEANTYRTAQGRSCRACGREKQRRRAA